MKVNPFKIKCSFTVWIEEEWIHLQSVFSHPSQLWIYFCLFLREWILLKYSRPLFKRSLIHREADRKSQKLSHLTNMAEDLNNKYLHNYGSLLWFISFGYSLSGYPYNSFMQKHCDCIPFDVESLYSVWMFKYKHIWKMHPIIIVCVFTKNGLRRSLPFTLWKRSKYECSYSKTCWLITR